METSLNPACISQMILEMLPTSWSRVIDLSRQQAGREFAMPKRRGREGGRAGWWARAHGAGHAHLHAGRSYLPACLLHETWGLRGSILRQPWLRTRHVSLQAASQISPILRGQIPTLIYLLDTELRFFTSTLSSWWRRDCRSNRARDFSPGITPCATATRGGGGI